MASNISEEGTIKPTGERKTLYSFREIHVEEAGSNVYSGVYSIPARRPFVFVAPI